MSVKTTASQSVRCDMPLPPYYQPGRHQLAATGPRNNPLDLNLFIEAITINCVSKRAGCECACTATPVAVFATALCRSWLLTPPPLAATVSHPIVGHAMRAFAPFTHTANTRR
jgi:hypothetical protein